MLGHGALGVIFTMSSGGVQLFVGTAYKPGGGPWVDSSDRRTKRRVRDYKRGLKAVNELRPVSFKYNGKFGTQDDDRRFYGLIADEVLEVMPEMIGKRDHEGEEVLLLDSTALIYALVNAVKTLTERIERLEEKK